MSQREQFTPTRCLDAEMWSPWSWPISIRKGVLVLVGSGKHLFLQDAPNKGLNVLFYAGLHTLESSLYSFVWSFWAKWAHMGLTNSQQLPYGTYKGAMPPLIQFKPWFAPPNKLSDTCFPSSADPTHLVDVELALPTGQLSVAGAELPDEVVAGGGSAGRKGEKIRESRCFSFLKERGIQRAPRYSEIYYTPKVKFCFSAKCLNTVC